MKENQVEYTAIQLSTELLIDRLAGLEFSLPDNEISFFAVTKNDHLEVKEISSLSSAFELIRYVEQGYTVVGPFSSKYDALKQGVLNSDLNVTIKTKRMIKAVSLSHSMGSCAGASPYVTIYVHRAMHPYVSDNGRFCESYSARVDDGEAAFNRRLSRMLFLYWASFFRNCKLYGEFSNE